jgi:hypothetical protein
MGREKLMKFTPETLLQIYLDGSFTEEAQAEFDALMRKDPLFTEQVTQAVAQRLGPLPEAQIDETAGRLDGKMDALWSQYKPSPLLRSLKFTGIIALGLASVGVLYFGVHRLWPLLQASIGGQPSAMLSATEPPTFPQPDQSAKGLTLRVKSDEKTASTSLKLEQESQASHPRGTEGGWETNSDVTGKNPSPSSSVPSNNESGPGATVISSSKLVSEAPPSVVPAISSGAPSTAEGDSLRVAIDMPKTQNVIVTVYDNTGLLIRNLYQGVLGQGDHYVDWDGKDEVGNAVLPGDYTVVLDLRNKKMSGVLKVLPK